MVPIPAHDLPLQTVLTEGARVLIGQGTAEPLTLTRALLKQAETLPPFRLFVGPIYSDTFEGELPPDLEFESYGAIGRTARLARAGRLRIYPEHFSELSRAFRTGRLKVDVVLLQLRPSLDGRGYNLGLARDFVIDAARRARHVIAEINPWLPACHGGEVGPELEIAHVMEGEHPPVEMPPSRYGGTEQRIASRVAEIIPDGAVLQVGVGAVPAAVLRALSGHRDLGFHSGAATDELVELAESGALTNARKELDAGVSVAGILLGSRKLYEFAHRNPHLRLAGPQETHSPDRMARLSRFHAINSAIEVDLTGQVNAETAGGASPRGSGRTGRFRARGPSLGGRARNHRAPLNDAGGKEPHRAVGAHRYLRQIGRGCDRHGARGGGTRRAGSR